MNAHIEKILQEVGKVIVGKEATLEKILMTVLSRGHVLLDDVPGTGKTTTALAFSRALGLQYGRIQFTPDVLPSDIVGFSLYRKESGAFVYQPGAVMTNLLLADEINRTSSKTQSALLEVMEERQVTVDGHTHKLPDPFVVIATQNPVGSAGTQLLPQAQLDRFMVRLEMGYPDFASQVNILRDRQTGDPLQAVQTVCSAEELLTMQAQAQQVHMADALLEYVTKLAEASRSHPLVVLGVSPRGALAVCRMCKSRAFMAGRDYVLPDDVTDVFADVCAHRIVLSPKARISETSPSDVLAEVLRQVISEKTSAQVNAVLEQVVCDTKQGTGKNAYVAGYHIAGKTGTSEKVAQDAAGGKKEYIVSFIGYAPADDPQAKRRKNTSTAPCRRSPAKRRRKR